MRRLLYILLIIPTIVFGQGVTGAFIVLSDTSSAFPASRSGRVFIKAFGPGKLYVKYADGSTHNLDSVPAPTTVDFAFSGFWGDTSDGSATISSNTTLTTDKNYQNLTVNSGDTLFPAGYRIFVNGTLTVNGVIANNGFNGNNGGNGTAASYPTYGSPGDSGHAQNGRANGSVVQDGFITSIGGNGGKGAGGNGSSVLNGVAGGAGHGATDVWGVTTASTGGAGGNTGQNGGGFNLATGGAGGAIGSITSLDSTAGSMRNFLAQYLQKVWTSAGTTKLPRWTAYSGGGGSGAEGDGFSGFNIAHGGAAGGGGAGVPGGTVWIAARALAGTGGIIESRGGAGGNGGIGGAGDVAPSHHGAGGGGGGGGGGGAGGLIAIFYTTRTGTITIQALGGAAGSGGAAGASSSNSVASQPGASGQTGKSGIIMLFQL